MFLKNRNISSKIKRSKVTDYAALSIALQNNDPTQNPQKNGRNNKSTTTERTTAEAKGGGGWGLKYVLSVTSQILIA